MTTKTLESYIDSHRFPEPIYVTRPVFPDIQQYQTYLNRVWETGWLTNEAYWHQEFAQALKDYLGVKELVLFCNGTIALLVALKVLELGEGEVITTPFTFPATAHVIAWNGLKPVFCDIDRTTYGLDPKRVEEAITTRTKAILPVHVYGLPCDVDAFNQISKKYSIPVIYDSAHTFGCRYRGVALCSYGDLSVLSFHATKLFTTAEGGALICSSPEQAKYAYYLKNFGIADEETVVGVGINGKMSELSACFGLAVLPMVEMEIQQRRRVFEQYQQELNGVQGIKTIEIPSELQWNYAYFPIEVEDIYGISRDELYRRLRRCNVFVRKYFFPLCNKIPCYESGSLSMSFPCPVAEDVSQRILCLPIYGNLSNDVVIKICEMIKAFPEWIE